jgi:hypothetical protein
MTNQNLNIKPLLARLFNIFDKSKRQACKETSKQEETKSEIMSMIDDLNFRCDELAKVLQEKRVLAQKY